jgi:hypothetical protein
MSDTDTLSDIADALYRAAEQRQSCSAGVFAHVVEPVKDRRGSLCAGCIDARYDAGIGSHRSRCRT